MEFWSTLRVLALAWKYCCWQMQEGVRTVAFTEVSDCWQLLHGVLRSHEKQNWHESVREMTESKNQSRKGGVFEREESKKGKWR